LTRIIASLVAKKLPLGIEFPVHINFPRLWLSLAAILALGSGSIQAQQVLLSEDFSSQKSTNWTQELIRGQSQIDTFSFRSPSYHPTSPIDSGFAFFDVYNAGKKGFSNGNGQSELIYLKSPLVVKPFKGESYVSFDYQFVRLRSPSIGLDITVDSGKTWQPLWGDSIGSPMAKNVVLRIDHLLKPSAKVGIRFFWETFDTLLHQGYVFFDNILIYNTLESDAGFIANNESSRIFCLSDSVNINLELANKGTSILDSVVFVSSLYKNFNLIKSQKTVVFYLNSQEGTTIPIKLGTGLSSGSYSLITNISNPDDVSENDTIIHFFTILDSLQPPKVEDQYRCGPGVVNFEAEGKDDDSIIWGNAKGLLLGSGKQFTTATLSSTDSFIAMSAALTKKILNTFQGPYRFNSAITGGSYFQLIAKTDLRISQITQHFASDEDTSMARLYYRPGILEGREKDTSGWIKHVQKTVVSKGWGKFVPISFEPIYVEKGDTISFYLTFDGKSEFTFKKGLFRSSNSDLNILCNGINDKLFSSGGGLYKSYSWDGQVIYETMCLSEPSIIRAFINPTPQDAGVIPHSSFSGVVKKGTSTNPDEAGYKHPLVYELVPPAGHVNSDFGVSWTVSTATFHTSSGVLVDTGIASQISAMTNEPVILIVEVDSLWADSILFLNMKVSQTGLNCDTAIDRYFRISKTIAPNFINSTPCLNTVINFTNTSSTKKDVAFKWDFDDGKSDTGTDGRHSFSKNKTYYVKLISVNVYGVSDTVTKPVTVNIYPLSAIRAIHTCIGTPAVIRNSSANASITNSFYIWLYDGDTIHKTPDYKEFTYAFESPGVHRIKLISNHQGCIDSSSKNVFQFANPESDFESFGTCQYDSFSLLNRSSISSNDKLGFRWLYDGKTMSTIAHPKGVHPESGLHQIQLLTTTEFNCKDTFAIQIDVKPSIKSRFDVGLACKNDSTVFTNKSLNPANLKPIFFWDFGDGNTSKFESPTHFYSEVGERKVQLISRVSNGCQTRFDTNVVVRVHPDAHFEVDDVCAGEQASFVNKSKVENKILRYRWYFGDGDSSTNHSPSHVYTANESALYLVRLHVYTIDGFCTDQYAEAISVHQNPSCEFRYDLQNDSLTYAFYPLDSSLIDLTWSFEGGGTSMDKNPIHTFQDQSSYLVRLFAKNKFGCKCIEEQLVNVGTSFVSNPSLIHYSVSPNPFLSSFVLQGKMDKYAKMSLSTILGKQVDFEISYLGLNQLLIQPKLTESQILILSIQNESSAYHIRLLQQ